MNDYMNRFADQLRDDAQKVRTENGALSYTSESIQQDILRLFYEVSATHKQIIDAYDTAGVVAKRWGLFQTDWRKRFVRTYKRSDEATQKLLLRLLGLIRDPRRGMGERAMFRGVIYDLYRDQLLNPKHLGEVVAEYGRWDDLIAAFAKSKTGRKFIAGVVLRQLKADLDAMCTGGSVSLLAKWMPKENTSSKETKRAAHAFIKIFGISRKQYRKTITKLRAHLKIVERDMSAQNWEGIDYSSVPSLAMGKYRSAFYRHDESRFENYLEAVKAGKEKINAGVASPAQVMSRLRRANFDEYTYVDVSVAQWNALPTIEFAKPMIPVCDVSGSMCTDCGGGAQCIDVSMALSVLLSQANTGPFKDIVLTFSTRPTVVNLSGLDIIEKVAKLERADWGGSTNIAATLRLVLKRAKDSGVPWGSKLPDLVIFSDMEFDVATYGEESYDTVFETLQKEFTSAGYPFPMVYFWNLSSNGRALLPLKQNASGLIELSGYSQQLFRMFKTNELDPFKALLAELNAPEWANMEKLWRRVDLTPKKKRVK